MAQFLAELNDLFGGFKERASAVRAALRSSEVSFVLVTSPAPMSVQEVLFFSDRLEQAAMPRGAFVVNRVRSASAFAGPAPVFGRCRASCCDPWVTFGRRCANASRSRLRRRCPVRRS
jgi:anion-transporting  ArsA/GET3 family ATPase